MHRDPLQILKAVEERLRRCHSCFNGLEALCQRDCQLRGGREIAKVLQEPLTIAGDLGKRCMGFGSQVVRELAQTLPPIERQRNLPLAGRWDVLGQGDRHLAVSGQRIERVLDGGLGRSGLGGSVGCGHSFSLH